MALKPLPALPKLPTVPKAQLIPNAGAGPSVPASGVYDTATSTYKPFGTTPPTPLAYSATGGAYDPNRSTFIPGITPTTPGAGAGAGAGAPGPTGPSSGSYLGELQGDPMYQQALNAFNSAIAGGQQSLAEQIKQQVIRSGYDISGQLPPSLAAQWGGALDPATLAAAAANPMSTRAQLQLQLQQGQSGLGYQLAARGVGDSGGYATGSTALQNQYDTQSYGAMNSLLDAINQGSQNYAQFASNQLSARNQAYESVAQRLAMLQYGANYGGTDPNALNVPVAPPGAPSPAAPGPVIWGGQQFTTKAGLANYLKSAPGGYSSIAAWGAQHPTAYAGLK